MLPKYTLVWINTGLPWALVPDPPWFVMWLMARQAWFLNSPRLIVLHCRTSSSSVYYPDFCPKSETNIQSVESWIGLYSNSEGLIHVHWLISNFWTFHHDPLVHSWGLRKDQAPKSLKWPAIILKAIKCIGLALGMMFSHYEFLSEVIGAVFSRPPYERDVIGCCRPR